MMRTARQALVTCVLLGGVFFPAQGLAQAAAPKQDGAPARADALGRDTPRGTVTGFLSAARRGEAILARQYLNTTAASDEADALARQLFEVLDALLPARLNAISDAPQGSRRNPLAPAQDVVATLPTSDGPLDIVLERVTLSATGPVWLFSRATLSAIPTVHADVVRRRSATPLQRLIDSTPLRRSRLLDWVVALFGALLVYAATLLLNRVATPVAARVWRRIAGTPPTWTDGVLPVPARLMLMALAGQWVLSNLTLSVFVRRFWGGAADLVLIAAAVWLLILANGEVESYVLGRMSRTALPSAASLVRLLRRGADVLVGFAGLLAILRLFAVDATPALAGLGVGGIAIALAAQKTLENVVAGASLIFDEAVRVGDTLKLGEFVGTVDHIGLRSTRMRTIDRTIVSVPNAQIANASLETLSARDKFWFHHVVGLRYETTPDQLRAVLDALRRLLQRDHSVDPSSIRVRFIRLAAYSLDIEIFAYVAAADWSQFLEFQEGLLVGVMETVTAAGAEIAFPSQMNYAATSAANLERL